MAQAALIPAETDRGDRHETPISGAADRHLADARRALVAFAARRQVPVDPAPPGPPSTA
ncbi:MAG: hypothetical protein MZV70_37450 [Desulfobacterales bacterium]|nr:hypothetical protein [Desulfobacterales bacterium]